MINAINIIPALSKEASGPSYSVVKHCESVLDSEINIGLYAMDWEILDNRPSFLTTFPVGLGPKRMGRSPKMFDSLKLQAEDGNLDILHNHGMWQMNSLYAGLISAKYRIPYIVSPRGTFSQWAFKNGSMLKRPFWFLLQRPSFDTVKCFHATAFSEYEDIRRLGFRQPVAVIPNGIDIKYNLIKQRSTNVKIRTILFLGRIHPKKGLDILLNAWAILQNKFPEWSLRIVGTDEDYYSRSGYLNEMIKLSQKLDLKRIDFSGPLYGDNKSRAYSEADLFVLPTHSENFGMTVAESLALGTPVVVSKGAPWSKLEKINAGRWIDIGIDPLINTLNELFSLPTEKLNEMGENGRNFMITDFSWQTIGKQMKELYKWTCGTSFDAPNFVIFD